MTNLSSQLLPYSYISYIHLLVYSIQLGSMIWMSFIQGILLFKKLSKQQFSIVQSILFPIYFILCTLGLTTLSVVYYINNKTIYDIHINNLLLMLLFSLCNQLYIGPKTTQLMWNKHHIERELNNNNNSDNNNTTNKQQLITLNKQFGMYHGISSLLNLLIVIGLLLHGIYINNYISNIYKNRLF